MNRVTLNHNNSGARLAAKRKYQKEKKAAAAEERWEESKKFRDYHIQRLDAALLEGGEALAGLVVWSDRLVRIAGEGAVPLMSVAQERRVREQALSVANYFRVIDIHYPAKELVDCAAIAAVWSGSRYSGWTVYRWSLDYTENQGKFPSDGRGDFDHDCLITSNEDIRMDLCNYMRSNLRGLNRIIAQKYINDVLIPKFVGRPADEEAEDTRTAIEVRNAIAKELKEKWRISEGGVCEYTAGRWMLLAGGEFLPTQKNYYVEGHESEENKTYREAYLLRDQGKSLAEPSMRELGQFLWVQMTEERAEELFEAHTADGAAEKLKSAAHSYLASGIEANFVGRDGTVTDESKASAMKAAVEAELPQTRNRNQSEENAQSAMDKAKAEVEKKIAAARADPGAGAGAVKMVELHVEWTEALDDWRSTQSCGGHVSVRYPRDEKPIIKSGQDESIFSSETAPSHTWVVRGKSDCTPKGGAGMMVSAFTNCVSGFGLPMTPQELADVNRKREGQSYICGRYGAPQALRKQAGQEGTDLKPPLKESPGVRMIHYGKDRDGYWDRNWMMVQMEDVADVMKHKYPGCKLVFEYDNSGVHKVMKEDGPIAAQMNVRFGGAVTIKHDTEIIDGCLGPHPAVITTSDGSAIDRKLKVGEIQSMVFLDSDPPPFYDPGCPKENTATGEKRTKKKKKKTTKQSTAQTQMDMGAEEGEGEEEGEEEEEEVIRQGYVGKAKGLLDVAFERGLLDPQRLRGGKDGKKIEYTKGAKFFDGIPDESYSLTPIIASCADFQNEPTAMEELTKLLGHEQEKTPKKHPELAGMGIEYMWGKSKMTFRRDGSYSSNAESLERRVRAALDPNLVLPIKRVRAMQRRSNDYKRSYMLLGGGVGDGGGSKVVEYADIEKMKKNCKTHRCSLDQDYKFIKES